MANKGYAESAERNIMHSPESIEWNIMHNPGRAEGAERKYSRKIDTESYKGKSTKNRTFS